MKKKGNTEQPEKDLAIARAQFCWETEVNSGRVLHFYGDKDGNKTSYPTQQAIETYKKQCKKKHGNNRNNL